MDTLILTSTKPYLIRALYDWINDNKCTPYVIVNADAKDVEVPKQYVEEGRIVLNISPAAVRDLRISNDFLEFNARFAGVVTQLYAPIAAILAIYAQENGQGMVFEDKSEQVSAGSDKKTTPIKRPDPHIKPRFKVIK